MLEMISLPEITAVVHERSYGNYKILVTLCSKQRGAVTEWLKDSSVAQKVTVSDSNVQRLHLSIYIVVNGSFFMVSKEG